MAYALGANPGTAPNANTFTSDIGSATRLATSSEFSKYLTEQIFEQSAMIQSGLLATDARMNNVTGVFGRITIFCAAKLQRRSPRLFFHLGRPR